MRNTILSFWQQWHAMDALGDEFQLCEVGATPEELSQRVAAQNQLVIDNSVPPQLPWTFDNYTAVTPAYLCLDKDTIMTIFKNNQPLFYFSGVLPAQTFAPQDQIFRFVIGDSPRSKGWTDQNGVKRAPTPSDLGKNTQAGASSDLGVPEALLHAIGVLKSEGKLREAGIVQFAYNQIINGQMTILEALDYLDRNRIFGP